MSVAVAVDVAVEVVVTVGVLVAVTVGVAVGGWNAATRTDAICRACCVPHCAVTVIRSVAAAANLGTIRTNHRPFPSGATCTALPGSARPPLVALARTFAPGSTRTSNEAWSGDPPGTTWICTNSRGSTVSACDSRLIRPSLKRTWTA